LQFFEYQFFCFLRVLQLMVNNTLRTYVFLLTNVGEIVFPYASNYQKRSVYLAGEAPLLCVRLLALVKCFSTFYINIIPNFLRFFNF
jgi:hypothetical protein